jgi:hypothetical protein
MRASLWGATISGLLLCQCGGISSVDFADASPDGSGDASRDGKAGDGRSSDVASETSLDTGGEVGGDGGLCGTSPCGPGMICIRGRCAGCCDLPPECIPIPSGCSQGLACGCFTKDPCGGCTVCESVTTDSIQCGNCMCVCAAPWTPIATPAGPQRIADLRVGDLVYTVDHGELAVAPLARVGHRAVANHAVVRVTLSSGQVIEMSGGHPTADGRRFDALAPGERLGAALITALETVPYDEPYTYDILPASESGTYFVGDAWIGSTLKPLSAPSPSAGAGSVGPCAN